MSDAQPFTGHLYDHPDPETQLGRPSLVPPYMDDRWRRLRGHLRAAAELARQSGDSSTTEDCKKFLGLAMNQLMDASFWIAHIERSNDADTLDGVDG